MKFKYIFLVGIVWLVLFGSIAPIVFAQSPESKPRPLAPLNSLPVLQPLLAPVPPQSLDVRKPINPPPSARARAPLKINVQELDEIDSDSVGTLTEEQGGFGFKMWEGTDRSLVEKLLPKLPANSSSRAMRSLMRRLLLSVAKSPVNIDLLENRLASKQPARVTALAVAKPKVTGELLASRIERLLAMGDVAAVDGLLKVAPNRDTDPTLLKNKTDVLFLSNDNARACLLVAEKITNIDTTYWQKALIYCQALAGDHDKANLGVDLLREAGEKDDVFFGLISSLTGVGNFVITSLSNPTPLYFSMIRAAKVKLPKDVTSSNNSAVLKTIATSPNANIALRIDTAERAESIGALDTDVLRQLYAGVVFSKKELDNALSQESAESTPLSSALLYRKALVENIPAVKAEILSEVFKIAREGGLYQSTARVYHHILKGLPATQDLTWFAPEAVRALLAADDGPAAQIWFNVLRTSGIMDEKVAALRDQLAPLERLTGQMSDKDWGARKIDNWWKLEIASREGKSADVEAAQTRATLLYNIIEALGDLVPTRSWEALLDGPPQTTAVMPQPALWRMLNQAVVEEKRAETVLICMLALGQSGPTQVNPIVLRQVVLSLRLVGLASDARALALEAAVAAGL
ncbi:MAG: hypothetical protein ACKVIK_10350 [Rhodospirillales bacterium]